MKKIRNSFTIFSVFFILCILAGRTSANWYVGAQRTIGAFGVKALISSPSTPLAIIQAYQSGVDNYVSTISTDASGADWIQTGWRMYFWDTIPRQYFESCIDCIGDQGTYYINDQFATQSWGTTIEYEVSKEGYTSRWCAYTEAKIEYCLNNLHLYSTTVLAESEIHSTFNNPLNTTFDEVRYKDPTDNNWKLFDDHLFWLEDFPYEVNKYLFFFYRTTRGQTSEIFVPVVMR